MASDSELKVAKAVCPLRNIIVFSVIISRLPGNSSPLSSPLVCCFVSLIVWSLVLVALQHMRHLGGDLQAVSHRLWHPRGATATTNTNNTNTATAAVSSPPTINATTVHTGTNTGTAPTWHLGSSFDPDLSTEDNYRANLGPEDEGALAGNFVDIRREIDYNYHKVYSRDRQLFQDALVESMLGLTTVSEEGGDPCRKPERNWIVFTAGVMVSVTMKRYLWVFSSTVQ
mgnify:CR=1 FL=1